MNLIDFQNVIESTDICETTCNDCNLLKEENGEALCTYATRTYGHKVILVKYEDTYFKHFECLLRTLYKKYQNLLIQKGETK